MYHRLLSKHHYALRTGIVLLVGVIFILNGCAGFRGNKIPDISDLGYENPQYAPKVYFSLKYIPGMPLSPDKTEELRVKYEKNAYDHILKANLFENIYIADPEKELSSNEYILQYTLRNSANNSQAEITGFICGFSLLAFPAWVTEHLTLVAKLNSTNGATIWSEKYDDSLTTVIWLPFIFLSFTHNSFQVEDKVLKNLMVYPLYDIQNENLINNQQALSVN